MNNRTKPSLLKLTVLLAVLFLVVPTWNHHQTVLAVSTNEKSCLLDETKYTLEPKDEVVKSITDLVDGVYSFELSTVRTGCETSGNGRNGMFTIQYRVFLRNLSHRFVRDASDPSHPLRHMQTTWASTTGPARRPWPPRKPPAQ